MLAVGAVGVVSVASHLVGERLQEMIAAYEKGDPNSAASIHHELLPLIDALFVTSNPIPLKAALGMVGMPAGPTRLPLVPATEAEMTRIRAALGGLGLT
jgi:4-hydroxy-tetrahydrodipicolinate synthase